MKALCAVKMARTEATLDRIEKLFTSADLDGSGALDRTELAELLKKYYRSEKMLRDISKVQAEVDAAMTANDADGSGTLDIAEFIEMLCSSPDFKISLTPVEKKQIKVLSTKRMAAAPAGSYLNLRA